jgi:hypothetical protein
LARRCREGPSTHQIQAPDRTSPALPLKKGRVGTMTDDYKRHGTTLFAALDGKVIQGVLKHPARSSCASCAASTTQPRLGSTCT